MERETIAEGLQKIEADLDLFSIEIDDVLFWEQIRQPVLQELVTKTGTENQAHDTVTSGRVDSVCKLAKNTVFKNPFLADSADVLFFGHSRRKLEEDGYWWDLYCDPIIESFAGEYVYLERPYQDGHLTPAKTPSVRYLDLFHFSGDIRRAIGRHITTISQSERHLLRSIDKTFEEEFGVRIGLESKVEQLLANRATTLPLYERLLRRIDPKVAVVVVSYGKETFIEACNITDIPVIELQHGVINNHHFGYDFPEGSDKKTFPDYLFTWGTYWNTAAEYPLPDDRLITIGYPYLDKRIDNFEMNEAENQILFISQGTIGTELSQFAVEVAENPEITHDIVYKLHPGEYHRWRNAYPWLEDTDIEVIDGPEPSLYSIFSNSMAQIGVASTAIYEGLAFDLETYIYDGTESSGLPSLVADGSARVISTSDDLVRSLGSSSIDFDSGKFFFPDATEKMTNEIKRLQREGSVYT